MQIRVRTDRVACSTGLTEDAEQRVRRAIGRVTRRVTRVGVRLFDLNGPRGGVDKACEVTVSLARAGTVRYRAVAESVGVAIRRAAAGTREAVARRLALRRDRQRHGRRHDPLAPELA